MWFTQAAHHRSAEIEHGTNHNIAVTLVNERDLEPKAMQMAPDETKGKCGVLFPASHSAAALNVCFLWCNGLSVTISSEPCGMFRRLWEAEE